MNSFDYLEVAVRLDPFTEEGADILMAELSELPFDSFVTEEPFLKCYIQTEQFRASDVKVILSGYPFVAEFKANVVQGQNWNKAWEESFQPIVVEQSLGGKLPAYRSGRQGHHQGAVQQECSPYPLQYLDRSSDGLRHRLASHYLYDDATHAGD